MREETIRLAIEKVKARYGNRAVIVGDGKTKEPARTIIAEAIEGKETLGERVEAAQYALIEHGAVWNDLGWLKKKRSEKMRGMKK
tara:strand:+ start:278 stop:532 length:255 start_codon:yes stop_codon:yes gene_type:complete